MQRAVTGLFYLTVALWFAFTAYHPCQAKTHILYGQDVGRNEFLSMAFDKISIADLTVTVNDRCRCGMNMNRLHCPMCCRWHWCRICHDERRFYGWSRRFYNGRWLR
jgi:hypothetical protein